LNFFNFFFLKNVIDTYGLLCEIPRGSGNMDGITKQMLALGKASGLEVMLDKPSGDVIMRKYTSFNNYPTFFICIFISFLVTFGRVSFFLTTLPNLSFQKITEKRTKDLKKFLRSVFRATWTWCV
jgi:hypothetical protein